MRARSFRRLFARKIYWARLEGFLFRGELISDGEPVGEDLPNCCGDVKGRTLGERGCHGGSEHEPVGECCSKRESCRIQRKPGDCVAGASDLKPGATPREVD